MLKGDIMVMVTHCRRRHLQGMKKWCKYYSNKELNGPTINDKSKLENTDQGRRMSKYSSRYHNQLSANTITSRKSGKVGRLRTRSKQISIANDIKVLEVGKNSYWADKHLLSHLLATNGSSVILRGTSSYRVAGRLVIAVSTLAIDPSVKH